MEQSVAGLEKVVRQEPAKASAWSDLSAAYLVRAQERDDPNDLIPALEAAEKSLSLQSDLPEARFNRALVLEWLGLRSVAWHTWQGFLAVDGNSKWAEKAQAHIQGLARPGGAVVWEQERRLLEEAANRDDGATVRAIVDRHRQAAREFAEQRLLGLWGDARFRRLPGEADGVLSTARFIGKALVELSGDAMVHDAVAAVDEAVAAGDESRVLLLSEGYRSFGEAFPLYKKYDSARALSLFDKARRALTRAHSPFEKRVAFWSACTLFHLNDYTGAVSALESLEDEVRGSRYGSLLGHIFWMRAQLQATQGDPMAAEGFFARSLPLFERAGETENVASINSLIGENLDRLGESREAWSYEFKALQRMHQISDPQLQYIVLYVAQRHFQGSNPAVALHFQNELVRGLAAVENPQLQASALLWRGFLQSRAGKQDQALRDLARVGQFIAAAKDASIRRDLETDLAMIEGEVMLATDPLKAAELLTSALSMYEGRGHHLLTMTARRARAHAYRAAGRLDLAEGDLRVGLDEYEKLGEDVFKEGIRSAFVHQSEEIFREMISFLAIDRRRPDLAFAYADRSRTRVLPGAVLLSGAAGSDRERLLLKDRQPLAVEEIRQALPERTVLAQLAVLDDRVLIWLIRKEGMEVFVEPIPAAVIRTLVSQSRNLGSAPTTGDKALSTLFDHLILPWWDRVGAADRIVFVPDTQLEGVPFSSLRDRSGSYLIESHEITVAPSASLFAWALKTRPKAAGLKSAGLVVGNPKLGSDLLLRLQDLPFAEKEAQRIAAVSPGSRLLLGAAATRSAFLEELLRASWVHFAGHALVNRQSPLLSMLVLAPASDGSDQGALYAQDIYDLDLRGTRLIVLAACDSAQGALDGGGGANLARAFLAAGARTVVATLWQTEDRASEELFKVFYDRVRRGVAPAAALRDAQLAMINSKEDSALQSPVSWAGFQVIGAD